ncbi:neuromedin-K receptor-like [Stylophora pistillata]|uniref:neuromedin-K receptor-like n=1 Tax=Stylophora pistillata TaxID=50429 RepID=UPI000C03DFA3|nr:neuromedin-K receptor-like [Stylophora pistillata]
MNVSEKSSIERQALLLANSFRYRSTFQVILESLIYGSIAVVAFIGNLLVLYIVYKTPRLRNVSGLFVASLALSDIGMATFGAPPSLASLIKGHWFSTFEACQFQGFVVITTVAASLQTMALMSVDRYFRVVHPLNHRIFFTMSRARLMSASVWILAMMYPVPYLVCGRKYIFHPGKFFCFHEVKMSFESCVIYICICISLGTLSFCYYNVFKHLRLNRNRVKNLRKEFSSRHENERRASSEDIKMTKTLFATVLGYLICWTPVLIIDFVDMASDGWSLSREVYVMYTDIGLISSSLNPIIYGALNRTFRREYNKIFCFKRLSRQTENSLCQQTNSLALAKL